jgi:hypothetical protein
LASRGGGSAGGDTRNKRLFGSDKPASVNLDGASFICVNAATLVKAAMGEVVKEKQNNFRLKPLMDRRPMTWNDLSMELGNFVVSA